MVLAWFVVWVATCAANCIPPSSDAAKRDNDFGGPPFSYDVYSYNAGKVVEEDEPEEGEAHGDMESPSGAKWTSISIKNGQDEKLPIFVTDDLDKNKLEHVYVSIHGKLRDGDEYWRVMDDTIREARADEVKGADREIAVVAPQFFSAKYNEGQYSEDELAWGDINAWQSGAVALHPSDTEVSSFDALDAITEHFANQEEYPKLANVTFVGHGGGGQLMQRYAVVGVDPPSNVHVRYIHGDPSSCVYFTRDRPIIEDDDLASKSSCDFYNTWRYGFERFPSQEGPNENKTAQDYFLQYISRDVISLVGYEDEEGGGDETCMAMLQGGQKRRNRNLIWYRYINMLADTDEDLEGFPGDFENITDWGDVANHTSSLRLVIVKDASHDMEELFENDSVREALFNNGDVGPGWRPSNKGD